MTRGPRRKPGASAYTLPRLSLAASVDWYTGALCTMNKNLGSECPVPAVWVLNDTLVDLSIFPSPVRASSSRLVSGFPQIATNGTIEVRRYYTTRRPGRKHGASLYTRKRLPVPSLCLISLPPLSLLSLLSQIPLLAILSLLSLPYLLSLLSIVFFCPCSPLLHFSPLSCLTL